MGVVPESGTFKTHQGLQSAFSLHLVKPDLFPLEPGRALQRAQSVRQFADYGVELVPYEDALDTVQSAENFVETAARLIATPYRAPA
jgi:uncharacterized protein (UPF0332 family)